MTTLSLTDFTAGTEITAVGHNTNNSTLEAWSTSLSDDNISSTFLDKIGVSSGSAVRRGKSIVATDEARTNVAYGTLTTPDQVANVVLPTDGLIVVAYFAEWYESVQSAARAAIFVGANQLRTQFGGTAGASVQEVSHGGTIGTAGPLVSAGHGLSSRLLLPPSPPL